MIPGKSPPPKKEKTESSSLKLRLRCRGTWKVADAQGGAARAL